MTFNDFLIKLVRFKPVGIQPFEVKKCVVIMAPHTSIRDFFIGRLMIKHLHLKMVMVMKKEFFVFPYKRFLTHVGCVPVDRAHAVNFTRFSMELIKNREEIAYIICPEGTRKLVTKWKRGFYEIALTAGVPIALSHIDFKTRTMGIGRLFYPTGDYDKDLVEIQKYYYGMKGLHKGQFNLENMPEEENFFHTQQ